MSDPWLDDESSVEDSRPREGLEFVLPNTTYRIALGDQDVEINGDMYTAIPAARGELEISSSGKSTKELEVTLPMSHELPQRYMELGVPPKKITVTLWRKQLRSGLVEMQHIGEVLNMSIDEQENTAKFTVPSRLAVALRRKLPTITAGRNCPNALFDENCKADFNTFSVTATVTAVDGPFVTVDTMEGNGDHYAQFGALVRVEDGEDMPIKDQVGLSIELQLPLPGLKQGDVVRVSAGCDLSITTCRVKFLNKANFRGFNLLPRGNPFVPTGLGIYTSG